jgi:hypothetical protein
LATNESDHTDYHHELDELDEEDETEQQPEVEQEQEQEPGPVGVIHEEKNEQMIFPQDQEQNIPELEGGYNENTNNEGEQIIDQVTEIERRDEQLDINNEDKDETGERESTQQQINHYHLRPNRERDYSYRFAFLSVREGLKRFEQRGKEAILEELKLFVNEKVFKKIKDLTDEQ